MKSETPGVSTSEVEVTNIDSHGFWLFVKGREFFLAYREYPWFMEAKVAGILNVELLHGVHLHWPALDVDLTVESLERSETYPLIYT